MQIFINYDKSDIKIAGKLFKDLKKAGLSPWLDVENLLPGQNWRNVVIKAIKESEFFITLLSNNSISKSGYFRKEIRKAFDLLDELSPSEIFIIPVRLDNCTADEEKLNNLYWVDIFPSYEKGFNQIIRAISNKKNINIELQNENTNNVDNNIIIIKIIEELKGNRTVTDLINIMQNKKFSINNNEPSLFDIFINHSEILFYGHSVEKIGYFISDNYKRPVRGGIIIPDTPKKDDSDMKLGQKICFELFRLGLLEKNEDIFVLSKFGLNILDVFDSIFINNNS